MGNATMGCCEGGNVLPCRHQLRLGCEASLDTWAGPEEPMGT